MKKNKVEFSKRLAIDSIARVPRSGHGCALLADIHAVARGHLATSRLDQSTLVYDRIGDFMVICSP